MSENRNTAGFNARIYVLGLILCLLVYNIGSSDGRTIATGKSQSSKTLRSMARVYMSYGEYVKALPLADKALTSAKNEDASDGELAMCLIDLATVYKNLGNLSDAEELLGLGLQLQEKALGNHPYLAYTLRTLSSTYQEMGKEEQANIAMGKSIGIMLEFHSADDKAMAPFYVDKAKLLTEQNRLGEAESYYQTAIGLINSSYGPEHLYTANVLGGIAKLYLLQERYAESEEVIDRVLAIQEKIYGANHHLIAPNWLTKAKICQVKGDQAQAQILIKKALDAVEKTGNAAAFTKLEQSIEQNLTSKNVLTVR